MAEITAKLIKELRDNTGAGIMDAKKALEDSQGDMQKAEEYLTKKGLASVEKRAGRATENGIVESYIHTGGRIGALVQLSCETDFVARTDEFSECAKEIANSSLDDFFNLFECLLHRGSLHISCLSRSSP